jgi:hypothetical protein
MSAYGFCSESRLPNRRFANLAGLKNGSLLDAAEAAGFEVLYYGRPEHPDQQDLSERRIALVILCRPTKRLRDLERLVPRAEFVLRTIASGDVVKVK